MKLSRKSFDLLRYNWKISIITILFFFFYTLISIRVFVLYKATAWDLGIFINLIWRAAEGLALFNPFENVHYFSLHFAPLIYLFGLFYRLVPSPIVLFVVQGAALASVAPLVNSIARAHGFPEDISLRLAIGCGAFPSLFFISIFGFHILTLALPVLLTAILFIERNQIGMGLGVASLGMLVREDMTIVLIGLGLYLLIRRDWRGWLGIIMGSVGLIIIKGMIMPSFGNGGFSYVNQFWYMSYILEKPFYALAQAITLRDILSGCILFGALLFIPLLAPKHLLGAVPLAAAYLLSTMVISFDFRLHYMAPLLPFLFWAWIKGSDHRFVRHHIRKFFWFPIVVLVTTYGLFPFVEGYDPWTRLPNHTAIQKGLTCIPERASIAASENLAAYLAERPLIYSFPVNVLKEGQLILTLPKKKADYIAINLQGFFGKERYFNTARDYAREALTNGYDVVYAESGVVVLQQESSQQERLSPLSTTAHRMLEQATYKKVPLNPIQHFLKPLAAYLESMAKS